MNTSFRLLVSAGALVTVLAGALWLRWDSPAGRAADPDVPAADPLEPLALPEFLGLLGQKGQERKRLEDEDDATLRRIRAKEQAAQELVAERSTLLATAVRFRDLDKASPLFKWDEFRARCPGQSDEERHCREVIAYVRGQLHSQPDKSDAVARRLEADLRRHLERGSIPWPEKGRKSP